MSMSLERSLVRASTLGSISRMTLGTEVLTSRFTRKSPRALTAVAVALASVGVILMPTGVDAARASPRDLRLAPQAAAASLSLGEETPLERSAMVWA